MSFGCSANDLHWFLPKMAATNSCLWRVACRATCWSSAADGNLRMVDFVEGDGEEEEV